MLTPVYAFSAGDACTPTYRELRQLELPLGTIATKDVVECRARSSRGNTIYDPMIRVQEFR